MAHRNNSLQKISNQSFEGFFARDFLYFTHFKPGNDLVVKCFISTKPAKGAKGIIKAHSGREPIRLQRAKP